MENLKKLACESIVISIDSLKENIRQATLPENIEANTKGILTLADAFAIISNCGTEKGKEGFNND